MNHQYKTIDEHVFGFIYDMALNDAFNRVAGLKEGDKKLVADNKEIKKIIKKYVEDVINGNAHCFYGTVDDIEKKNEKLKIECFVVKRRVESGANCELISDVSPL